MSFNKRVLAYEDGEDMFLQVHEVLYDKNGKPDGYTVNGVTVGAHSIESMLEELKRFEEAIRKPILWAGDRFPEEYVPEAKDSVVAT